MGPSYIVAECKGFAGKILKLYSQNICGISYTDGDYPVSIRGTDAENFFRACTIFQ